MDLDELLFGNPSWNRVVVFFQEGDFPEEPYLIQAIEKHLLTEDQREIIHKNRMSIEKMLNGRISEDKQPLKNSIYKEWNQKLGFKHFG